MSVLDAFRLDDTVALVTGANRGLGAAASVALSQAGAHVVLAGRSADSLQAVAEKITSAGGSAETLSLDVRDEDEVVRGFAAVAAEHDGVDVLVNNAGVQSEAPALSAELAVWETVISTNLTGSFLCAREFARLPARRQHRSIVNVASLIAERGVRGQLAYGASKAGVVSITRTLALELAADHIRVNAIAPGYFDTDMPAEIVADEQARARLLRRIPQRRLGNPAEIGAVVVFLASAAASYMTGATIYVDGGFTA